MERCEILYGIIARYDADGDYLHPSRLISSPEVTAQMSHACAYKHLAILEERGLITMSKVTGHRPKPMLTGKRDSTTYEYAHQSVTKFRSWDPNKKLIFIEELATMNNDEKERLFSVLDRIDDKLGRILGTEDPTTKEEQIKNREVKG